MLGVQESRRTRRDGAEPPKRAVRGHRSAPGEDGRGGGEGRRFWRYSTGINTGCGIGQRRASVDRAHFKRRVQF